MSSTQIGTYVPVVSKVSRKRTHVHLHIRLAATLVRGSAPQVMTRLVRQLCRSNNVTDASSSTALLVLNVIIDCVKRMPEYESTPQADRMNCVRLIYHRNYCVSEIVTVWRSCYWCRGRNVLCLNAQMYLSSR